MTKTIAITESLLLNTVRSPGFLALNAIGSLLLVSLSLTGKFSLGRELLMIRESAFGTIFVLPFACSILACAINGGLKPVAWRNSSTLAAGSRKPQHLAFIAHSVLAGLLSFFMLTPFLVSGLCFFHSMISAGLISATIGVVSFAATAAALHPGRISPSIVFLPPILSACATCALLRFVPDGVQLIPMWAFSILPVAMVSTIAGASCAALRGIAGPVLAVTIFLAANLRSAAGETGMTNTLSRVLPDLAGLNPSIVVSSGIQIGFRDFSGAAAYTLLIMLAAAAAATGAASLREEPV